MQLNAGSVFLKQRGSFYRTVFRGSCPEKEKCTMPDRKLDRVTTIFLRWISAIIIAVIGWALIEITSGYLSVLHCAGFVLKEGPVNWIINTFVMLSLLFVISIFIRREWKADVVFLSLCFLWATVNDYVTALHGSPFSFADLRNIGTAINVLDGYRLGIDSFLALDILIFAAGLFYVLRFVRRRAQRPPFSVKAAVLGLCVIIAGYYACFFMPQAIRPMQQTGSTIHTNGYPISLVDMTYNTFYRIHKPDNYDKDYVLALEASLEQDSAAETDTVKQKPDIILILNESFFDLRRTSYVQTDRDPFDAILDMKDVFTGWCVIPSIGGGTNQSEYELLTGNSLYLIPQDTPFNLLDMTGATSIVSVLERYGYHTTAMHPKTHINYQRGKQYAAMGFDKSYFINDFSNLYGIGDSTGASDASVYENLLRWYRADIQQEDVPQFVYCLTYQNHGGFSQRAAEYDTIHAIGDYDFADEFDEYLTGIDYSIQAFSSLIRELDKSDRPVIVCMMGDHCPYLINYNQISLEDRDLVVRSVPILWWSNADYTFDDFDTISINYVSSILFSKIGFTDLSPMFRYQQSLISRAPVITTYGYYYNARGDKLPYGDDGPEASAVRDYFSLEYNNITRKATD